MIDTVKKSVTIASSASLSGALEIPGQFVLSALIYPAMTTSLAFTFLVSLDGIAYTVLYDIAGSIYDVTIPSATAGAVAMDPALFYPWEFVKLKVADNQTGDKVILCAVSSRV